MICQTKPRRRVNTQNSQRVHCSDTVYESNEEGSFFFIFFLSLLREGNMASTEASQAQNKKNGNSEKFTISDAPTEAVTPQKVDRDLALCEYQKSKEQEKISRTTKFEVCSTGI